MFTKHGISFNNKSEEESLSLFSIEVSSIFHILHVPSLAEEHI